MMFFVKIVIRVLQNCIFICFAPQIKKGFRKRVNIFTSLSQMRQIGHGVTVMCRHEKTSRIPLAPALLSNYLVMSPNDRRSLKQQLVNIPLP